MTNHSICTRREMLGGLALGAIAFAAPRAFAEELMRTASDFTRRQPALVFGLASLAGFVLLRVLKSNPDAGSSRNSRRGSERFEGSGQFHGV